MAFAVTAWKSYPLHVDAALTKRFTQCVEMVITGANTDIDADIGDISTPGQFFTDAIADATYGTIATNLKTHLASLVAKGSHLVSMASEELDSNYDRVSGAPALGTEYQVVTFTSHLPEILFVAGGAPTSWKLTLHLALKAGEWPLKQESGGTGI